MEYFSRWTRQSIEGSNQAEFNFQKFKSNLEPNLNDSNQTSEASKIPETEQEQLVYNLYHDLVTRRKWTLMNAVYFPDINQFCLQMQLPPLLSERRSAKRGDQDWFFPVYFNDGVLADTWERFYQQLSSHIDDASGKDLLEKFGVILAVVDDDGSVAYYRLRPGVRMDMIK